jgi:hypothetical protein
VLTRFTSKHQTRTRSTRTKWGGLVLDVRLINKCSTSLMQVIKSDPGGDRNKIEYGGNTDSRLVRLTTSPQMGIPSKKRNIRFSSIFQLRGAHKILQISRKTVVPRDQNTASKGCTYSPEPWPRQMRLLLPEGAVVFCHAYCCKRHSGM